MVFRNIGFLGCGNMGGALAGACAKRTKHILLANRTPAKAEALAAATAISGVPRREARRLRASTSLASALAEDSPTSSKTSSATWGAGGNTRRHAPARAR